MRRYDFEQSIGYWTILTAQAIERAMNEALAPHGITGQQCKVLGWLNLDGELSQSELADRMRIEPPTLAGILDRMERAGWIVREPSPDDRRKKIVRVTEQSDSVWSTIVECALTVRARATQGIPAQELRCTMQTLARILDNFDCPRLGKEEE